MEHRIDVFVTGDDWTCKFDHLKTQCEVIYLPRAEGVSTTRTKAQLRLALSNWQRTPLSSPSSPDC